MNLIYRHIFVRAIRLFLYFALYVIVSVIIITVFGVVYKACGLSLSDAVITSFDLFFGIEANSCELNPVVIAIEYIARDVIFVTWIGFSLSRLLSPVNPIYFADNFTLNSDGQTNTFSFRYWFMLKSGRFLYDVEVRVYVPDPSKQTGKNQMATSWSRNQHLNLARGIRYIDLVDDGGLEKCLFKEKKPVTVMIHGTDEDGKIYYRAKTYTASDCLCNHKFISVLKKEYCELLHINVNENDAAGYPFVQFDNFNKTLNETLTQSQPKVTGKKIQNKLFSFWLFMGTPCWEIIKKKLMKKKRKQNGGNHRLQGTDNP